MMCHVSPIDASILTQMCFVGTSILEFVEIHIIYKMHLLP
jgi:hypothetical protein